MIDTYTDYYLRQAGSGFGAIYSGPLYQRGRGIGSFLSGLFRFVLPILKRGSVAAGKELFSAGAHFIDDINNKRPFKESLKERASEVITNLKRKATASMSGSGYKAKKKLKLDHFSNGYRGVKSSSGKIKKATRKNKKSSKKTSQYSDIFI